MTQRQCTKRLNGLRGTTTRTSQSSILGVQAQLIQEVVIHLATGSSHGAAAILPRSLSQQAFAHLSSNVRASSRCKVGPSSSYKTRTHENSLISAISVDALGTKHWNVGRGLKE